MNEPISSALLQNADMTHAAPWRTRFTAASRRGVLAALAGGLMAPLPLGLAVAPSEVQASSKRKKRKNKKKKKQRGPVTRADATCPGPSDDLFIINGGARFAQTFTATASGPLVRAELGINKNSGSNGDYLLSLSPVDDAGVPTNAVLAVALVPNANVADGESTVAFAFPDPATVAAGVQFALVLTRLNDDSLTWVSRAGDVCVGRGFVSNNQSAPFAVAPNTDFIFTTFVRS